MHNDLKTVLEEAVEDSRKKKAGKLAAYIPELACIQPELVTAAIHTVEGHTVSHGDECLFTLQSVSKLVPFIGLCEEFGKEQLNIWTNLEPSGQPFSSIGQVDRFGPVPSNPMVNAGAIALCGRIPGGVDARLEWLNRWIEKLFGHPLAIDEQVFQSEHNTGLRNRSIAYLLKSNGVLPGDVEDVLTTYHQLCSFVANIESAAYLPLLLANGGKSPSGDQVISQETCNVVVSVMATCGLYDESGTFLVNTGMPAKSGVSGLMVAVALGHAGIAVYSPRVNDKGGSVRGHAILQTLSEKLGWHFCHRKP